MKVALHDMDSTGFPNLALCKLAAYHRALGDVVQYNRVSFRPDKEYGSRVFSWSPKVPVGVETGDKLPDDIEHTAPDTSDYDVDPTFAYGFTSRGCIRKCEFCSVWRIEGMIRAHAHPSEFIKDHHKRFIMLDNNWLAAPNFEETATWLAERRIKIDPTQGLDIRLVTEEKAKLLAKCLFTQVKFAFDDMKYADQVTEGVQILRHWRVTPMQYQAYVLHRPNDDALDRILILEGLYVDPFVMPYIGTDGIRVKSNLARWANKKQIYRKTAWENYKKSQPVKSSIDSKVLSKYDMLMEDPLWPVW